MSRVEQLQAVLNETARGLEAAERQISRITDRQDEYFRNAHGESVDEQAVYVNVEEGAEGIQNALETAVEEGLGKVRVYGRSTDWEESVTIPDHCTIEFSDHVQITIPEAHSLTAFDMVGDDVFAVITNENRESAEKVVIRGGELDFGNPTEETNYAGFWLHNANRSLLENAVCRNAGQAVYGHGRYRSYNHLITDCYETEIRQCEGYNSGYDDIGVRGNNDQCRIVNSGGAGGSSGTIQSAAWIPAGYGSNTNITYKECWGERLYDHGGDQIVFDNCRTPYRIQTLGSGDVTVKNSQHFQGRVLLYSYGETLGSHRVENMSFDRDGHGEAGITIGLNGADATTFVIDGVESQRPGLLDFDPYDNGGSVELVKVLNSQHYAPTGASDSATISHRSSGIETSVLSVNNLTSMGAETGITGSYDTVRVAAEFINGPDNPVAVSAADVETEIDTFAV